jgi:phage terminase large subunit-like protein
VKYSDLKQKIKAILDEREHIKEKYCWEMQARDNQKMPNGDWRIWMIVAGRGFGKTRTGAETIRKMAQSGKYRRFCLLGDTLEDVQKVMVEGESGLLSISPQEEGLIYQKSQRKLVWANGAKAFMMSARCSEKLRGPQFDAAWIDEWAKFKNPEEVWNQLLFCLRLGNHPRLIITTTPKSQPFLKQIMKRNDIIITKGSTYDNQEHLPESYIKELQAQFDQTRIGAQEIHGQILDDHQGALWKPHHFQYLSCSPSPSSLHRIVVAIDPAVTHHAKSDETGIVVTAKDDCGKGYVLDDLSGVYSPTEWIDCAAYALQKYQADRIVAEVNNGGDLVQELLYARHPDISYRAVRATRGKYVRAEPIACLYEQKKIFHQKPFFELEQQMLSYTSFGKESPDRMDALVWGFSDLFLKDTTSSRVWIL